jgi:5-methylcytosine-specific restriction endonuclease McrA
MTATCEQCGRLFKRHRSGGGKDAMRFCSRQCAGVDKHQRAARLREVGGITSCRHMRQQRACVTCGNALPPKHRKYCSSDCVPERPKRTPPVCLECGRQVGRLKSKFCSRKCMVHNMKNRPVYIENKRKYRRARKGILRARKHAVRYEPIDPMRVFTRDGWRCQLCGCATPLRLRGQTADRAPELDHIVPLSCGGSHTHDNVQCACRSCNSAKGARPMGQQRLSLYAATA